MESDVSSTTPMQATITRFTGGHRGLAKVASRLRVENTMILACFRRQAVTLKVPVLSLAGPGAACVWLVMVRWCECVGGGEQSALPRLQPNQASTPHRVVHPAHEPEDIRVCTEGHVEGAPGTTRQDW